MTDIMLNSQKINQKFPPTTTLKELVLDVSTTLLDPSDTITNVIINDLPRSNLNASLQEKISSFRNINFEVKNIHQMAFEALETLSNHLNNVIDKSISISPYFRKGKISEGMSLYCELIEFIDIFIRSTQDIIYSLRELIGEDLKTQIDQIEKNTLLSFQKILSAQEKGDHILLADLLEYELNGCFNEWKNEMIPKLKNLG